MSAKPKVAPTDHDWIESARRIFEREGELEIDPGAPVSCADPVEGAYVQAWVWVSREEVAE